MDFTLENGIKERTNVYTLTFKAIGEGNSSITLTKPELVDANTELVSANVSELNVNAKNVEVKNVEVKNVEVKNEQNVTESSVETVKNTVVEEKDNKIEDIKNTINKFFKNR